MARGSIEQSSRQPSRANHPAAWPSGDRFSVNDERIWLDALPSAFHGLRIVQISDIPTAFLPENGFPKQVRQANRLNPDIIALTGDFVTYSGRNIGPAAELLGRLRARYGVYAVLGNHDFRVDADAITQALRNQRIDVLRNRHHLRFGADSVYLVGVDDYGYGADLRRRLCRGSARRSHHPSGAQSTRDPSCVAAQCELGAFRTHARRTGEPAPSRDSVRALARTAAV